MRATLSPHLLLILAPLLLTACSEGSPNSQTGGASSATAASSGGSGGSGIPVDRGPTSISIGGDPNGLFWDAATSTLYIADDDENRFLKWSDVASSLAIAGTLPAAPPDSPGLGQVVKTADGKLVVPRFGGGTAGDVAYVDGEGNGGVVPNLDVVRRRIGLTVAADGSLYDTYFVSMNGVTSGAVARLDLAGSEVDVVSGLTKPVGVIAVGSDLIISDQDAGAILKAPIASPKDVAVIAQLDAPALLCEGPDGTLFTGGKTGSVRQVFGDGKWSELAGGFQEVRGVAYDAANKRLFVADHDGTEEDGVTHSIRILPVD